jgi:hypothetical protein
VARPPRGSSHVPAATRIRLAAALTPLFGSDAIVWTRDAADLTVADAVDTLVWMARALITAALSTHAPSTDAAADQPA